LWPNGVIARTAGGEFTSSFSPDLVYGLDALRQGEDPI
jgi:hypothetical protein